jgi:hypothetical protein
VIAAVEIGVRDLRAAEAFYGELLGVRADERLALVESPDGRPGGWVDDDRQLGVRHLAFYVADVDGDVIGQLFLDDDGMVITFLDGPLPLELFSFPNGEVLPDPGAGELGIRPVSA